MNWKEIKTQLANMLEDFARILFPQDEPQQQPIPVEIRHPEQRRQRH